MADYRGVAATCAAVIYLLRANYQPADFNQELEFSVYSAQDFAQPMEAGVSLFLHRIYINGAHRAPAGRIDQNGRRKRNRLPLDLHFLLTAWGREASTQQAIVGWMMRTLEDTPILPAGLLNTPIPDTFARSEAVELSVAEMNSEDLFHLWEVISPNNYHISIPYTARNIRIESEETKEEGLPVQERSFDYREIES